MRQIARHVSPASERKLPASESVLFVGESRRIMAARASTGFALT